METTDDGMKAAGAAARASAMAVVAAVALAASDVSAQEPAWTAAWGVTLQTRYDDNPLRLNDWEKANVGTGLPQFEGIDRVDDVLNTLRLRGVFRGPGLGGRPVRLEAELPVASYTFNRRRPQVTIGGSARQELTRREELEAYVSFTPSEFQRNYLTGVDEDGSPVYAEGASRRLQGGIGLKREIVRGPGPELDAGISLHGTRRTLPDFPWRDRNEVGARVDVMLQPLPAVETEVSASRTRTHHASVPEPVSSTEGVTMMATRRDYVELELEATAAVRLIQDHQLVAGYVRRNRAYTATLDEDDVYGDRRDYRNTYRTELRFRMAPAADLTVGGAIEEQSRIRPGRGDTGDEADYRRTTFFLGLSLFR